MPGTDQDFRHDEPTTRGISPEVYAKIRRFVEKLKEEMNGPLGRGGNLAYSELKITYGTVKAMELTDPKRVGIFASSMLVQKAMLAAGIVTSEEQRKCADAIGNLAADFGLAATLGIETAGLGAILPLAAAALDSYDMANSCFNLKGGMVTHAVASKQSERARNLTEIIEKKK